jgi:aryl-alcohol dehydrogenase-like predicted oxidoreductase
MTHHGHVEEAFETSLKALGTDYIDLVLCTSFAQEVSLLTLHSTCFIGRRVGRTEVFLYFYGNVTSANIRSTV